MISYETSQSARLPRVFASRVFLVAVATLAIASSTAPAATAVVPAKLLGKYSRTIAAKVLVRTSSPEPTAVWSLTFHKDGTAFIQGPNAFSAYQRFSALPGGRITFRSDFCSPPTGSYRWRISGRRLTLTTVADRCGDRSVVLTGVWKRR
jgi:hypothetical protein